MSTRLWLIALLGTVSLTAACGSDHTAPLTGGAGGAGGTGGTGGTGGAVDAGPTPRDPPPCVSGTNAACLPSGFPFVTAAFAHSSGCNGICPGAAPAGTTILFSQTASGTLCLSGTNPALDGTALLLSFSVIGGTPDNGTILKRFNADALGITQVRFTIDRPPSGGITVGAATLHSDVCHGLDCLTFGFELPTHITQSGTTTAALVDFVNTPPQPFDTRALDDINFAFGPGDFDLCLRDFQFLDANGAQVIPQL